MLFAEGSDKLPIRVGNQQTYLEGAHLPLTLCSRGKSADVFHWVKARRRPLRRECQL